MERSGSAESSGFAGEARQKRKRHWIYPYGAQAAQNLLLTDFRRKTDKKYLSYCEARETGYKETENTTSGGLSSVPRFIVVSCIGKFCVGKKTGIAVFVLRENFFLPDMVTVGTFCTLMQINRRKSAKGYSKQCHFGAPTADSRQLTAKNPKPFFAFFTFISLLRLFAGRGRCRGLCRGF